MAGYTKAIIGLGGKYRDAGADATGWDGLLDDVRIYDRALGAEDIQAIIDTEPEGLLAHWALDETTGRVAYDSAGTCDGVLLGGPVWQPAGGMVGGALNLDGSNDCVLTDFVLNPADGPFSVFAWVKGGTPGEVIVSQDGSQDGADWLLADTSAGRLMTDLKGSGRGARSLSSATSITDGHWHRVGLVWDGAGRTLYVDEVAVAEDMQAQLMGSTGGLNIGAGRNLDPGTFWSGLIDDVRIYDQPLSAEEIVALAR